VDDPEKLYRLRRHEAVRCQGPNGPGGPLGLGLVIRLSPCLGDR
jgi:hypothetical protein